MTHTTESAPLTTALHVAGLADYIKASAALQGIPLSETRIAAVATHLARTQQLASLLDAIPLMPEDELAEIYNPLPFSINGDAHEKL